MLNEKSRTVVCKTWKTKTVATLIAVTAAVAVPQIFHLFGAVTGLGTALGETFLPMHLAIFMVGLLAGAWAGLAAGALSPLMSFLISGMPTAIALPFMTIELAVYGLTIGLLANTRLPVFIKLLIAQVAGRAVRAITILIAFYGFGAGLPVASIWTSIVTGLFGIILQWTLIPLLMFWIGKKCEHE